MEGEIGAEIVEELAAEVERGRRFLDRLELPEAEEIFRDILQRLPTYRSVQTDQLIVSCLFGLGDLHAKHCRSVRDKELEWLCGMLFALLFYRVSSEVCAKVVRHRRTRCEPAKRNGQSKRNGSSNGDYFSDTMSRAKAQANAVEMSLLEALKGRVLKYSVPYFHLRPTRSKADFDDAWLEVLWDFCSRSADEYQRDLSPDTVTDPQGDDTALGPGDCHQPPTRRRRFSLIANDSTVPSRLVAQVAKDSKIPSRFAAQEEVRNGCPSSPTGSSVKDTPLKRKINFDRFQDAIKQFVSDVSQGIRTKYSHISGKIPHGLLEQRVCSELALRLSTESDDSQELQDIFEALLNNGDGMSTIEEDLEHVEEASQEASSEEEEEEEEEVYDDTVETIDLYITPSAAHSTRVTDPVPLSGSVIPFDNGPGVSVPVANSNVGTNGRGQEPNTNKNKNSRTSEKPVTGGSSTGNSTPQADKTSYLSTDKTNVIALTGRNGVLTKWRYAENGRLPGTGSYLPMSASVGFEELSQFTEKKERSRSSTESEVGLHKYITEAKLSQLLGYTCVKLADSFKKDTWFFEACRMYKYAFGIFAAYPLVGGQQETLAKLLVEIGVTCCSVGELESGSQLMKEAAALYENCGETLKVADVWYQLGNVYLSDNLRQESILARVMQMTKEDVQDDVVAMDTDVAKGDDDDENSYENCDENSEGFSGSSSEDGDTYFTCICEAIDCYKKALEVMGSARDSGQGADPDLLANILTNLADCRVMTGNLDQAEQCYEEALRLFSSTVGTALLQKNAHVLCLLGTLSFLSRNYVRAATMYETSHILRQHLPDIDEPTLEMAWSLTMLGLSYHFLGHYHESVTWCIRSFKLYTRFFRGRLLTVDALSRWFIVENLYVLGFAYITLSLHKKALHYLNFCKNMTAEGQEDEDVDQSLRVLLGLGEVYAALGDEANASRYYDEAQKLAESHEKDSRTATWLCDEVCNRSREGEEGEAGGGGGGGGGGVKVGRPAASRRERLIHERKVGYQRNVETAIKDEMVAILLKLGFTTSSERDIDWAIGCYDNCVQGYRDLHESGEAARALASLGTLCQVKGWMLDDGAKERQGILTKAEKYFREAFDMVDSSSSICVQLGNFLYGEGRHPEAVETLLPFVFCERPEVLEISYCGIEQMALPAHLRCNIEEEETLVVEARLLAKFLGVLCFLQMKMPRDVDDALVEMYQAVVGSSKPLNYTLLGYALLECHLFQEAAESFMWASRMQPESDLAHSNAWTSLLLSTYASMARGLDYLLQFVFQPGKNDVDALTFQEKKNYLRRQTSYKARKKVHDPNADQTKRNISEQLANFEKVLSSFSHRNAELQGKISLHEGLAGRQGGPRPPAPSPAGPHPVSSQGMEARVWQQERRGWSTGGGQGQDTGELETGGGTGVERKKWRSRLYHNLPEATDS